MKWNWQQEDWPNFRYNTQVLGKSEALFLQRAGIFSGCEKYLNEKDSNWMLINILSDEALKTSEIEGEYLDRTSVQLSFQRNLGLETSNRKIPLAEQGIAEMMVDVYHTFTQPLTHKQLFNWHAKLLKGQKDLNIIGGYRKHASPMQVVSGRIHAPKVHYEAPPSSDVKKQMIQFITWFNKTAPAGKTPLPALTRAGIAHFYFVCIHPFEDGNGRIGRAIAQKVLSQHIGQPILIALSNTIQKHKKAYYSALENNSRNNEITDWLFYFASTVLEAQDQTQKLIEFIINKTKLFDRVQGQLNERQEKVLNRICREGPDGFKGGLSAEKYINLTKTSRATATRDLTDLVNKNVLIKKGELKSTRYYIAV